MNSSAAGTRLNAPETSRIGGVLSLVGNVQSGDKAAVPFAKSGVSFIGPDAVANANFSALNYSAVQT